MRLLSLTIKILLAVCCIYFSFRIPDVNTKIDNAIKEKYAVLNNLRKNPTPDTAVNRIRYIKKKAEIDKEVLALRKKISPSWTRYFGFILPFIGGVLIRDIWRTIFKKKRLTE